MNKDLNIKQQELSKEWTDITGEPVKVKVLGEWNFQTEVSELASLKLYFHMTKEVGFDVDDVNIISTSSDKKLFQMNIA